MNLFSKIKLNWYDNRETRRLVYAGEYVFSKPPERILDLGAHEGIVTEYFARKYPSATIHSYEPNPALYRKLVMRARKYLNVHTFNEAIAHDGFVDFVISERNVSSSLFGEGRALHVPSVSLRTVVDRIGSPVFVKMDIEGAEYEVLMDIPEGIQEITGELHPEKAGRTNEEARVMFANGGFDDITIGTEHKCLFSARRTGLKHLT